MKYKEKFMKNTVLGLIVLIGCYTLARNNLFLLPDQIMWITHTDIFYKVFLPLLMVASALISLIKKDRINFFYLSVCAMIIDAINRMAIFISNYYVYFTYDPPPKINYSPDAIIVTTNYLPSYIMLFIEIVMIILTFRYIFRFKPEKKQRIHIGIGLPITEEPSHSTGHTDRVSGGSADQAD